MILIKTIFSIFLFLSSSCYAFQVPQLRTWINDYASIVDDNTEAELNALLQDFKEKTGNQFVVLTIPSMEDASSIDEYAITVADKWKIGKKGKDNGVILIIAAKERKVKIEVAYGLEGVLPDIIAGRIINDGMIPYFKEGKYSEGIVVGVLSVVKKLGYDATGNIKVNNKKKRKSTPINIIFLIIIILSSFFRFFGRGLWFGGFGGGGFGSGGGSGFSGGGGGSFGGGGASGSW